MSDAPLVRTSTPQGAFLVRPEEALEQLKAIQAVVKEVMKEGEHYGTIPGTPKPSLYKPGAELLNNMYGYRLGDVEIVDKAEQWDVVPSASRFPLFRYLIRTRLVNGSGDVISTGIGECNSYEGKYRWRDEKRKCPECGKETIIKGKQEYGGGWLCFAKKGGCGMKFTETDPAITGQTVGRVANENIFDLVNTLLKMAKKRSYVDATLSATRTSGLFTQDIEDFATLKDIQEAEVVIEDVKPTHHAEEPLPKPDRASDIRHPSEAQLKRLFAIAKSEGVPTVSVKTALKGRYNVAESKELSVDQYNELCGGDRKAGLIARLAVGDVEPESLPVWPEPLPAENQTLLLLASNIRNAVSRNTLEEMLTNIHTQFDNKIVSIDQSVLLQGLVDKRFAQL